MKKFLSLVLALVMTMSLVTVSAGAKDFTDSTKIQYTEAVDVMSAVKVIDGYTDGSFNPSATLTRGAAAKIICNLILGPTTASALVADAAPYKDVPTNHTFAGYIAYCQKTGIISGYADGTFKPANSLTGYAFMKMLLGALGYKADQEGYTGANWSIQVAKRALNIGLADDLVGDFNGVKAVNREEACLYAFNTLKATMVEYDKNSTVTVGNITIKEQSDAKEMANTAKTETIKDDNKMQFAEKYFTDLKLNSNAHDDFARPANQWKVKAEEIGTYSLTPDATYTAKAKVSEIYKDLGLGSTVKKADVTVYVDGVEDASQPACDIKKGDDKTKFGGNGVLTEVFYDDDADTITITEVNTYVGTIAKSVKATSTKDAYVVVTPEKPISGKAPISANEEFETEAKFEDDAYVLYTYSKDAQEIKSVALATKVEGTVTRAENDTDNDKNDAKALTIDGTKYKDSKYVAGEKLSSVSVKEDYTVYLDAYGYMIYVEENEEIGNYALVLDTANKGDFVGKKAELLFTDGTTKVVTTEKDYSTGTNEIKDNRIVTYKVDADGVYTLREVDTKKASYTDLDAALDMKNDRASITITADNTNGKLNKSTVTANSATVFVVRDTVDTDDYTAYTGIKNAPTIKTTGATDDAKKAGVYLYCKSDNSKMVTVMFIIPGAKVDVSDESSDALYLSNKSISNLIHDSDDDYYEFNAIVNGEIKTVKVADDAKILDKDGNITSTKAVKADGLYKSYATNKYGVITTLREFTPYSDGITKQYFVGEGIDKVSKEYTVILNTAGKYSMPKNETITVDDKADIYYVDKDGNISTSSYKSIAVDDNDQVYAIVKDYLVKTLVIFEVKDPDTSKPVVKTDGTMSITADVSAMEIAYVSGKIDGTVIDGWKTAKATAVVKATVNGDTYTETTKVTTDTEIKDIVDALKLPAEISSIGTGYKVNVTVNLTFEGLDGTTYTVAGSTVVYS
ncbi:S-layer homology domain-containing protein [Dysosmobacter sp.]|uniref:S-layer homology domain-containing protein n=1 Tax=Dysosmobacter sp. TaxID=2591382 RepID=UPI003AEF173A